MNAQRRNYLTDCVSWLLVCKKCGNCRNSCGACPGILEPTDGSIFCEQNQDVPDTSAAHSSGIGSYHPVGLVCAPVNFWNSFLHIAKITYNMDMDTNLCVCVLCHAKLFQSCPTLCDHMDCSLPGSSVHGILQSRLPRPPSGDLSIPGVESCLLHHLHCRWILYHWASGEALMYVHVYIY